MTLTRRAAVGTISVATLFVIWWVVSTAGLVKPGVIPPPGQLAATALDLVEHGYARKPLWVHVSASMARALSGFLLSLLVGIPAGLVIGYYWVVSAALTPILSFLRPIPAIAFIPLVILYFGIGEVSKVAIVFMTSTLYVILNVSEGVRSVPRNLIRAAENMGVGGWQLFTSVIFPATLPYIVVGIKTAVAISWALVVAAELVAAQEGLGYIIMDSATFFRITHVYIGIALIGVIGLALERLVAYAERRWIHWVGR